MSERPSPITEDLFEAYINGCIKPHLYIVESILATQGIFDFSYSPELQELLEMINNQPQIAANPQIEAVGSKIEDCVDQLIKRRAH